MGEHLACNDAGHFADDGFLSSPREGDALLDQKVKYAQSIWNDISWQIMSPLIKAPFNQFHYEGNNDPLKYLVFCSKTLLCTTD